LGVWLRVRVVAAGAGCVDLFAVALLLVTFQEGNTAAILASSKGHEACLRMVMDAGADVNLQTNVWAMHFFCKHRWVWLG
jgi:hypothetical protein